MRNVYSLHCRGIWIPVEMQFYDAHNMAFMKECKTNLICTIYILIGYFTQRLHEILLSRCLCILPSQSVLFSGHVKASQPLITRNRDPTWLLHDVGSYLQYGFTTNRKEDFYYDDHTPSLRHSEFLGTILGLQLIRGPHKSPHRIG